MRLTALALVMTLIAVLGCTRIDQAPTPTLSSTPSGSTGAAEGIPTGTALAALSTATQTPTPTPDVPMSIDELAWVADGIEDHEVEPLRALRNLAELEGVEPLLLEKRWLHYMVESFEIETLVFLDDIAMLYESMASEIISRILAMPTLDAIYEDDILVLGFVLQSAVHDADATRNVILESNFIARTDEELRVLPLAFLDQAAVEILMNFDWFKDGVSRVEAPLLMDLALIRLYSPEVFDEIAGKTWINRTSPFIGEVVGHIVPIATGTERDSESALAIAQMQFLESDKEQAAEIVEQLAYIHLRVPGSLASTLAHPRVGGDVSYSMLGTAVIAHLEFESPNLAAHLWELPWAIDSITELERGVLRTLDSMRRASPEIETALIENGWVEDGIQEEDTRLIRLLAEIEREQEELLDKILNRPWLAGNATWRMGSVVRWLADVNKWDPHAADLIVDLASTVDDPDVAREVVADLALVKWHEIEDLEYLAGLPWAADGLVAGESRGMQNLALIQISAPSHLDDTLAIPWVQDGTDPWEAHGLWVLQLFAGISQAFTTQPNEAGHNAYAELITKRWVRDGLNEAEINTITSLHGLARESREQGGAVLNRLIHMPFLSQISGAEPPIVEEITAQVMEDRQRIVDILLDTENGLLIYDDFDRSNLMDFANG